jgi:hypothetical protein
MPLRGHRGEIVQLDKKILTFVFECVVNGKETEMRVKETSMERARAKLILQGIFVKSFLYTE